MKIHGIILLTILFLSSVLSAQTEGILTVSVVTAPTLLQGRSYAPKNTVVIWIEDETGLFIKTLLAYGQIRINMLDHWEASSEHGGAIFDRTDAISGATRMNHDTLTCAWDGSDINGRLLPDGTYKILMELTDIDGTGNFSTYTFEKGKKKISQTPPDQTSFSSVILDWKPL